ncbi:enoyl-CoA hydratase/isomerase family protein [Marimonas sp. MJW-29]|uniref:Enoyl-CoA hydratase/isomerase family protein n=1 Tax=Sulfitobacter sediminis TaxID=3234186 RepID=A0ABV3RLT2_9RHOB
MIDLEKEGEVWTVTLNRPDKANSLTHDMLSELADIMESARSARAVILTGKGKVFSAGADLDEARAGLARSDVWERLSGTIVALPGLTIAALNGTLAGGAMGMALACDLRIAVPGAKFFYPVMKLGFLPQPSDPARMAALIGPARTKLILMGGQRIDAEEALRFGLIDRIVEGDELVDHARMLTELTVAARPEIANAIKEMCGVTPEAPVAALT